MPRSPKPETLRALAQTWKACRLNYPGWVIAPPHAREAIWDYTEHWVEPVLGQLGTMENPDALVLLRELFWRVEVALNPLFMSQVKVATSVLESINPAPDLLPWPPPSQSAPKNHHGRDDLLEAWVEVAFSLLREARDDFDIERFQQWHERLASAVCSRPHWLARWHYEQSLFALARFDFSTFETAVNGWPTQLEELPFWEVRRAALLAEFGHTDRAQALADAALQAIRARLPAGKTDYGLLSAEGWAMHLLMMLKRWGLNEMPKEERQRFHERFLFLARHECNPWEISDGLKLAINRPRPLPQPAIREVSSFDPGRVSQPTHFTTRGLDHAVRPAFAFLRLFEEAGVPMRVGNVTMVGSEASEVPLWIAPFAYSWALATALRANEEKIVGQLLDRGQIASLAQDEATRLANWLLNVLETATANIGPTRAVVWDQPLWERILPSVVEALSRLAFRADLKPVKRLLNAVEALCRMPFTPALSNLYSPLDRLFERILDWSLPKDEALRRIGLWLFLPLPSEIKHQGHHDIPEPLAHVNHVALAQWSRPQDPALTNRIQQLLTCAAGGSPLDRRHASLRLATIALLGGLQGSEATRLRKALWNQRDASTDLPKGTQLRLPILLRFCPLPRRSWTEIIRRRFLQDPIPPVHEPTPDGSGSNINPYRAQRWIDDLQEVTRTHHTHPKERPFKCEWSSDDALILAAKFTEWWRSQAFPILPRHPNPLEPFVGGPLRSCAESIVDVLADAVLPRLAQRPTRDVTEVLTMIDEMDATGVSVIAAKPLKLLFGAEFGHIVSLFLRELLSTDPTRVRNAAHAMQDWAVSGRKVGIPALPTILWDALVWKAASRSGPALSSVLCSLAECIRRSCSRLSPSQVSLLGTALEALLHETEIPPPHIAPQGVDLWEARIPLTERPAHQRSAALLAKAVEQYLTRHSQPLPEVISRWRKIGESSPLPEVRRVWKPDTP